LTEPKQQICVNLNILEKGLGTTDINERQHFSNLRPVTAFVAFVDVAVA
jgi:hypothetical protein